MIICPVCHMEIKVGDRVVQVHMLSQDESGQTVLTYLDIQHANCYDADGPKYNEDGTLMEPPAKGYIKRD